MRLLVKDSLELDSWTQTKRKRRKCQSGLNLVAQVYFFIGQTIGHLSPFLRSAACGMHSSLPLHSWTLVSCNRKVWHLSQCQNRWFLSVLTALFLCVYMYVHVLAFVLASICIILSRHEELGTHLSLQIPNRRMQRGRLIPEGPQSALGILGNIRKVRNQLKKCVRTHFRAVSRLATF